jgi:hypothetical protein
MHRAGARFSGDMVAQDHRHFPVIEGMTQRQSFQIVETKVAY